MSEQSGLTEIGRRQFPTSNLQLPTPNSQTPHSQTTNLQPPTPNSQLRTAGRHTSKLPTPEFQLQHESRSPSSRFAVAVPSSNSPTRVTSTELSAADPLLAVGS